MSKNTLTNILIPSSTTYQASSGDTWATSPSLNLSNSNEKVWTLRWQPAAVREYTEESFMAQMTKERFDYFREYCWSALPYTSTCLCLPWKQQDIRQGQVGLDRQEKFVLRLGDKFVCCVWVLCWSLRWWPMFFCLDDGAYCLILGRLLYGLCWYSHMS